MYKTMALNCQLSDIGEVFLTKIDTSVDIVTCNAVKTPNDANADLVCVGGIYYIDQPHQIRRLTDELAAQYGLTKFFVCEQPEETPVVKKTRKKKND